MKTVLIAGELTLISGVADADPYYEGIGHGFLDGFWQFCQRHVRATATVLDIGANIGITSLILSRVASEGYVHAFEPAQAVFAALKTNIAANRAANVTAHQVAIGARRGSVQFESASAYGHVTEAADAENVECDTIDNLVAALGLPTVDFIKIDVEGYEPRVLDGGRITIERFRPLMVIEFNSFCLSAYGGTNPFDFAQTVVERFGGYRFLDGRSGQVSERMTDPLHLLHSNMVQCGCVNDLVLGFDQGL